MQLPIPPSPKLPDERQKLPPQVKLVLAAAKQAGTNKPSDFDADFILAEVEKRLVGAWSPDHAPAATEGLRERAGDLRSDAVRGQETRAQPGWQILTEVPT